MIENQPENTDSNLEQPVEHTKEGWDKKPDEQNSSYTEKPAEKKTKRYSSDKIFKIISALGLFLAVAALLVTVDKPTNLPPSVINSVTTAAGWETVYKETSKSVVQIKTENGGNGTGFYYTANLILTAAHVINSDTYLAGQVGSGKTPSIDIVTANDETYLGKVIGIDPRWDIAVIQTKTAQKPLPMTDKYKIGQEVAALGYPFSQELTITDGLLSAVRFHPKQATDPGQAWMLQTNAITNPGSSGGPLLDGEGKVVGMVALRPTKIDNKRADGMALAVPSDILVSLTTKLSEKKLVEIPWAGFVVDANLNVTDIADPSPAKKAGVQPGDKIVEVDSKQINNRTALYSYIAQKNIADEVLLTVSRSTGPINIKLNLEERP